MLGKVGVIAGYIGMKARNLIDRNLGIYKRDEVVEKTPWTVKTNNCYVFSSIGSTGIVGDSSESDSMYQVCEKSH